MFRKMLLSLLAVMFVFGTSGAFAQTGNTAETETTQDTTSNDTTGDQTDDDQSADEEADEADEEGDDDADDTDDADKVKNGKANGKVNGKGHNKPMPEQSRKGLQNALENVKGTPAESVIQGLLDRGAEPEDIADMLDELDELLDEAEEVEGSEDTDTTESADDTEAEDETTDEATDETTDETADETDETADDAVDGEDDDATEDGEEEGTVKNKKNKELIQLAKQVLKDVKVSGNSNAKRGQAYKQLAEFFANNEEWVDAIESQEGLLELNGDNPEAFEFLGELYEAAGLDGVKAFVNGKKVEFDVAPFIKDGRTLVPFRAISESLDAEVAWNAETKTVTVTRGEITVELTIGSNVALVNGQEVTLDVPASITNGRTVVPARFLSEALEAEVNWVPEGEIVVITDEETAGEEGTATEEGSTTDETTEQQ